MTLFVKILLGLALVYLAVALAALFGQRKLMYVPDTRRSTPAENGLSGIEERVLDVSGGDRVIAWYGRAAPGQPTILYFHGNAGSLSNRSERIANYLARGRGVFMMTYRGFGGSTGSPSEAKNVADAKVAYQVLRSDGVLPEDIILYGESIGTGVAVQVAAEKPVAGIILDAPYTLLVDVAVRAYPYLPVRPFLWDRYETLSYLGRINAPLLVVHGERDRIIPASMGRAVHAAAAEPKEIALFPEAGHSDHYLHGSYEAINDWIDRLLQRRVRAAKG